MQTATKKFPIVDHSIDQNEITEEIEEDRKTSQAR